jgi:hypothetical protein
MRKLTGSGVASSWGNGHAGIIARTLPHSMKVAGFSGTMLGYSVDETMGMTQPVGISMSGGMIKSGGVTKSAGITGAGGISRSAEISKLAGMAESVGIIVILSLKRWEEVLLRLSQKSRWQHDLAMEMSTCSLYASFVAADLLRSTSMHTVPLVCCTLGT